MAKIVNIEWMQLTREFQCPYCSVKALNATGKVVQKPCCHFLFSWNGERNDFEDFTDEVESILDDASLDVDGPSHDSLVGSLPPSATIYLINTQDEACGPIVRTDAIAFAPMAA